MCVREEIGRDYIRVSQGRYPSRHHLPLSLLMPSLRFDMLVIADHSEGRVPVYDREKKEVMNIIYRRERAADIYGGEREKEPIHGKRK